MVQSFKFVWVGVGKEYILIEVSMDGKKSGLASESNLKPHPQK